jgi:2-keto-3-deoxy-L-fuconate dehydrogenase
VGIAAYSASKGGVIALTRSIADFVGANVRANTLCPATVPTPLVEKTYRERAQLRGLADSHEPMLEARRARIPLGRLGTPQDVVGLAAFLLRDEASWITGQTVVVDGGDSMA